MSRHEIRGRDLYDAHEHRIATSRGKTIFDDSNNAVATIEGEALYDTQGRRMAWVDGSDIYDSDGLKVGTFSDVQNSIRGAADGILHAGFWYCFVR